jgi:hypothetical protein
MAGTGADRRFPEGFRWGAARFHEAASRNQVG